MSSYYTISRITHVLVKTKDGSRLERHVERRRVDID